MKYLVVLADGAGGEPIEALGGKTTLETADMKYTKALAEKGEVGMVQTIPTGCAPGSDAGNLSVMGYDPAVYLTGRSPLEAASIGIDMVDTDAIFRVNTITLSGEGEYEDLIIADHSAGEISTAESDELIQALKAEFDTDELKLYTGVSYRHCMVWHNGSIDFEFTPPHDKLGDKVGPNLPRGEHADMMIKMMKRSYEILKDHPVNLARIEKGLNPANSMWPWGEGRKPGLSSFKEKYGITGAAISAVDLIKGIAICAGLESIDVEGATGNLNTNYEGKAEAAIKAFREGKDFVYMHLEGPDECGHQGDMEGKILSLERIDQKIVKPIIDAIREDGEDVRFMIVPDHRTPLAVRTHTPTPVPFVIYDSTDEKEIDESKGFNETSGMTGRFFDSGFSLADYFFKKN